MLSHKKVMIDQRRNKKFEKLANDLSHFTSNWMIGVESGNCSITKMN